MGFNKFYPCLICDSTEKSIQTYFCNKCETVYNQEVLTKYIFNLKEKESNNE